MSLSLCDSNILCSCVAFHVTQQRLSQPVPLFFAATNVYSTCGHATIANHPFYSGYQLHTTHTHTHTHTIALNDLTGVREGRVGVALKRNANGFFVTLSGVADY